MTPEDKDAALTKLNRACPTGTIVYVHEDGIATPAVTTCNVFESAGEPSVRVDRRNGDKNTREPIAMRFVEPIRQQQSARAND